MAKSSVIFDAYYLISSESPSVEDLTGCLLTIEYNDGEKDIITLTSDNITQPASNVIDVADGMVVVTSAENITYGSNTFPSIGTYFRRRENKRASSIFKGTLEKLNSKFIDTDSLPKETLKITVTLDKAISTVNSLIYHSDKTSDSIKVCLDHGGIPYVEFHFYTTDSAAANDYELLTYSGYSNTLGYMFTNAENGNLLCINGHTVSIYSSTAKTELDSTVKTTEQTLTDEQKAQARTNIGAGTQYILPEASSSEFGGIKADDVTETDTQAVRKGADGKLYTAAAVPQVQSDYTQNDNTQTDYIKNRPFYEDTLIDVIWDGNTTGKTEVDLTSALGFNVYLVSDATPSAEDLIGATLSIYTGSDTMEIPLGSEYVQTISDNIILLAEGYAFVILADNSEFNGITFPSKGTYLVSAGGSYVSGISKKVVNKLDRKFLDLPNASPDALGGVKADSAEATDTQPVRIGTDGKLYTGGADISLGISGASAGQMAKIKTVNESGAPTAWEAGDDALPLLYHGKVSEEISGCEITGVDGIPFSLSEVKVRAVFKASTASWCGIELCTSAKNPNNVLITSEGGSVYTTAEKYYLVAAHGKISNGNFEINAVQPTQFTPYLNTSSGIKNVASIKTIPNFVYNNPPVLQEMNAENGKINKVKIFGNFSDSEVIIWGR